MYSFFNNFSFFCIFAFSFWNSHCLDVRSPELFFSVSLSLLLSSSFCSILYFPNILLILSASTCLIFMSSSSFIIPFFKKESILVLFHEWNVYFYLSINSVQFCSVTQSCPTLCDPMDCSTPGLPVHHQLLEFTQTHVHWVGDAIQPSHSLSSPSHINDYFKIFFCLLIYFLWV